MRITYCFYLNFPRFTEKRILIHRNTCGHCNDGQGQRGTGINEGGFWTGQFKQHAHASEALRRLNSKFQNPPLTGDCDCI
jgi:hypothetical protein